MGSESECGGATFVLPTAGDTKPLVAFSSDHCSTYSSVKLFSDIILYISCINATLHNASGWEKGPQGQRKAVQQS